MMEYDLQQALSVIKAGGVILYPTDTIPGIGCDATCSEAVERIFKIKHRPSSKSMISLVDSVDALKQWLSVWPEEAITEIEKETRPLTVIFDSPKGLAQNLLAEDGSAAFRVSKDLFCKELCRLLGKPIVSTSANISGKPTPLNFDEIETEIIEGVDYVCNFNTSKNPNSKPSKIIKVTDNGVLSVIRE